MPDDAELLRRYADTRSEPAFAALVARHLGLVYASALRRLDGDPHRAADVAQNVFIALARHAPTLARRPVLASWLHTATRHAVIDLLRVEHRRRAREDHAHTLALVNAPEPTPTPADWDQLRPLLDDALDQLSEPDRALLLLRFFEQHSFADAAARLHLTEDAARMRSTRALDKLRQFLARRGITSTTAALTAALTTQTLVAAPAGLAASITSGALLGSVAATTSSLLMTTATKTLLATAALITTLAIGTAVYESRHAEQSHVSIPSQLDLRKTTVKNSGAPKDNVWLTKISGKPENRENYPISPLEARKIFDATWQNATKLREEGRYDEAVDLMVWCYENAGVSADPAALRHLTSTQLANFANMLKNEKARVALEKLLRDAAARQKAAPDDKYVLMQTAELNRAANASTANIELFDSLPETDNRKVVLGTVVFDTLVGAKRYLDALAARPAARMFSEFESSKTAMSPSSVVANSMADIEALVGAGRIAEGQLLIEKVIALDNSAETRRAIQARLNSAGYPELLPAPKK
jgi:RNA polymerase sigma factor (sigma-70 family)